MDVFEDHDWMLARIPQKQVSKVRTTNGQDEFMSRKVVLSTRQGNVNEQLLVTQIFCKFEKALMVVVPL